MIDALISGRLRGTPSLRTGSNGASVLLEKWERSFRNHQERKAA